METIHHTVYLTEDIQNGMYYIGVHSTDYPDDEYYGSGTLMKRRIAKYGKSNLCKSILGVFATKLEAYEMEAYLVTSEMVADPRCMNLTIGGRGHDGYKRGSKYTKMPIDEFHGIINQVQLAIPRTYNT